jgi:threonine/homoserine/homoserine lactone efflux protein
MQSVLPMAMFALAAACTPGPNNIMLTASGVNFGFSRSLPHLLGVIVGYGAVLVAAGSGLGLFFTAYPGAQLALKIAGASYMIWLAWKVANNRPEKSCSSARPRPLTFLQAAAFQWVNPKGVVMALSATAIFVHPSSLASDMSVMFPVFLMATVISVLFWTGFGSLLSQALQDPRKARIFNIVMALLLVASIVPMVL